MDKGWTELCLVGGGSIICRGIERWRGGRDVKEAAEKICMKEVQLDETVMKHIFDQASFPTNHFCFRK